MYAGVMIRRMLDTFLNKAAVDDKDFIGNKRYELSGQMLSLLFEDSFKTMISQVRKEVDLILFKKSRCRFDFLQHIRKDFISNPLERAISTGHWCIKRFRVDRKGVTQVLGRLSYIQTLGFLTKIHPQFEKSMKVSGPRALHPSQFGVLCPCDTPEGESCGLVKNLALMSNVTADVEEDVLINLLHTLGVQRVGPVQLHLIDSFLVFFNGRILGKCRKPEKLASTLRKLRRSGRISEFVSVYVNKKQHCVYIASDGGRICRPLVIADKGVSRVKKHHIDELVAGVRTFDDFLHEGLIEYIDVNEENDTLIATYEDEAALETTHFEIDPSTILGVVAGLIPFPNHNQSPRNTYQCAMGKQAMGNIAYNQFFRMDSLLYTLVYPQKPLVTTKIMEWVNFDKLGAGQNATVAVMSYSGYDIEDAIVLNKASLDRGFGRCLVMKKKSAIMQRSQNGASERIIPPKTGYSADRMQALDYDGIAAPGQYVQQDDVLVNKQTPMDAWVTASGVIPHSQYRSTPVKHSGLAGDNSVVDKVALFSDKDGNLRINLIIRQQRIPEIGDKFSSRHGQKGVCGLIVEQEDLPFSDRGICPDLIMNPHGFPSRMTCGKLLELPGSKAAVSCGRFHHGTAFGRRGGYADKIEDISETLVQHGFSYSGKDFLYSGITGEPLQAYIFMGPIYYQKLKHMVVDKMHARGFGPRALLTRQPTEGRARNGGLRVGEMERDSLIAYGASGLVYERLMLSSDPFVIQVCRSCGLMGYYNHRRKLAICSLCKSGDNISTMKIPYACKLLFQELTTINIVPRLTLCDA
ncbi:unnamed protein product [Amaranthus hypochondriacus]